MKKPIRYILSGTALWLLASPLAAFAAGEEENEEALSKFDLMTDIFMLVFLALIAAAIIYGIIRGKKTADYNCAVTNRKMPKRKLSSINSYMSTDPNFSPSEFKEKAANLYIRLQNAIEEKDMTDMTPYLADNVLAELNKMTEDLRKNDLTNYIERVAVLGTDISGWTQENGEDIISVTMKVRSVNYTKKNSTGAVVKGSFSSEIFQNVRWELSRRSGQRSSVISGTVSQTCPKCGGQVDINLSSVCQYCGSVLSTDSFNWKICSMSTEKMK